ncbi:hypothetical protein PG999_002265 [Apiospora kogelbergensis]|uniref:Uncharacterized protein n=1 Tax=Apiospora kogelbergensis TaxID=1337665 RepID=A0AAW0R7V8_9PEZI
MAHSETSSDESGGGAPLGSNQSSSSTTARTPYRGTSDSKSDSPTDEEIALVRASSGFAKHGSDKYAPQGPNPFVGTGPSNYGHQQGVFGNQIPRPGTAMPRPQNFGNNNNDHYMTSPPARGPHRNVHGPGGNVHNGMPFKECAAIQDQLVTAQQYIRISPGISSDLANNIQGQLITIGQELNSFFHNITQEFKRSQYQAGELRVHMERLQQELLARKKQIDDLQAAYTKLTRDHEAQVAKHRELSGRLGDAQGENAELQSRLQGQDMKHMSQVQKLENEIKAFRMSGDNPMQLVKVDSSTGNKNRRSSALNPNAPAFGPRAGQSTKAMDKMPMPDFTASSTHTVVPYDRKAGSGNASERPLTPLAKKPNFGRQMPPQDARAYETGCRSVMPEQQQLARDTRTTSLSASTSGQSAFMSNLSSYNLRSQNNSAMSISNVLTPYKGGPGDLGADSSEARNKVNWEPEDIQGGFGRIFEMMEGLVATQHCTPPYNDVDRMLHTSHPDTWAYILALGLPDPRQSATHMAHLLGDEACRHFVIKRIIVDYIFNQLVSPDVFKGFSDEMDGHLRALQESMRSKFPENAPGGRPQSGQRQRLIEDHSKLIKHIIYSPEGPHFRDREVTKHVNILSQILRPMRNCTTDDQVAHKALRVIINYAFLVTSKLWTSSMTIHYFFPDTGSKFSHGQMRQMNHMEIPAEQLQYSQWRVMLVVSPTLSLRDDRNNDSLRTHELMKSDVLVMK